jgi:SET domain-containing protein
MPAISEPLTAVEVRHSVVHGHGVFAIRFIAAGTVIGRYTGRRYEPDQVHEHDWDHDVTHVFGLSDGSVIDGADGGNATRYINHSCAPNCVAYEIEGKSGELHIEIEALSGIRSGTELFLDYGLDVGDNDPANYPCRCGVRRCRGTMAARAPA